MHARAKKTKPTAAHRVADDPVADAILKVTAFIQTELEAGRRSARLGAHDPVDLLLVDRPATGR